MQVRTVGLQSADLHSNRLSGRQRHMEIFQRPADGLAQQQLLDGVSRCSGHFLRERATRGNHPQQQQHHPSRSDERLGPCPWVRTDRLLRVFGPAMHIADLFSRGVPSRAFLPPPSIDAARSRISPALATHPRPARPHRRVACVQRSRLARPPHRSPSATGLALRSQQDPWDRARSRCGDWPPCRHPYRCSRPAWYRQTRPRRSWRDRSRPPR